MKTVLLKFSGPLQSWGTDSHFETRHTDTHPSKSGVIGMIAAGLGYRREDDKFLRRLNRLQFAVRIDQAGQMLRDYHTSEKHKENGEFDRNYVTNRYYIQDAVFVVALSSDDEELIGDVRKAVTSPYFQLYLGRRSLPPTADFFLGIEESDAVTALRKYPWQASAWYRRKHSSRLFIFADRAAVAERETVYLRNDEAVSFSQIKGRKFQPRQEVQITVDAGDSDRTLEHDAFGAIGED